MERNVLKKRLKGLLVFILVFMMMFGSSLTVFAKNYYFDGSKLYHENSSEEVTIGTEFTQNDAISIDAISISGGAVIYYDYGQQPWTEVTVNGGETHQIHEGTWSYRGIDNGNQFLFSTVIGGTASGEGERTPAPGQATYNHTHDYKWEISLMPTEERDGWCDYRCECGSVTARQPISMFYVIIRNIIEKIEEAPVNGTVTVNSKYLRCLTDEIVEALLARPDVTLDVKFIDKEVPLHFTIPAGMAPVDGEDWYGYYYLGTVYGWIWE